MKKCGSDGGMDVVMELEPEEPRTSISEMGGSDGSDDFREKK